MQIKCVQIGEDLIVYNQINIGFLEKTYSTQTRYVSYIKYSYT
jgi:hypothetical protein